MRLNPDFEIMKVADDYMAIPLNDNIEMFNGVVALNEESAYLLENMKNEVSIDDLVNLLVSEYEVDSATAMMSVIEFVKKLKEIGMIQE